MAERIQATIAIQRELIEGVEHQSRLHRLIAGFAGAQLYDSPNRTVNKLRIEKLRREIIHEVARRELPYAQKIGTASARPVLEALGGRPLATKGLRIRGKALSDLRLFNKNNLVAFRMQLKKELGLLSSEVEAAFAEGYRDKVARTRLIKDLVESDRAELKQIAKVRTDLKQATQKLRAAERKVATVSKRKLTRARREVREARKQVTKNRGRIRATKSFYARFETRVQAHARDTIRRECAKAQEAAFRNAGFGTDARYTWVAINGTDACPSCEARHGRTMPLSKWPAIGKPGTGQTYCGSACMCQLMPTAYTQTATGLEKPLRAA